MEENKLSEELRHCLEGDGCSECSCFETKSKLTCPSLLQKAYEVVRKYEEMFPCKVGDIVWQTKKVFNEFPYLPYPIKVTGFSICDNGTYLEGVYGEENKECSIIISEIGKSIFLTKGQAYLELSRH